MPIYYPGVRYYTYDDSRRFICPEFMAHPILRHVRFKCIKDEVLERRIGVHMSLIDIVSSIEEMIEPELLRIPIFHGTKSTKHWLHEHYIEVRDRPNSSYAVFYQAYGECLSVHFQGRFIAPFFKIPIYKPHLRAKHNPDINPSLFEEYSLLQKPIYLDELRWHEHRENIPKEPNWKFRTNFIARLRRRLHEWEMNRAIENSQKLIDECRNLSEENT